jgi:hypothetical protein
VVEEERPGHNLRRHKVSGLIRVSTKPEKTSEFKASPGRPSQIELLIQIVKLAFMSGVN